MGRFLQRFLEVGEACVGSAGRRHMKPIGPTAFGHRRTHLGAHGLRAAARPVAEAGKMCVSGLFGRNASGRGRTWHVHAWRMNMAGCWTWVLEAHGEQGVQMKAHFYTPAPAGSSW